MKLSLYTAVDLQIELKQFIKQARKQKKMTLSSLAERSGVPYGTLRKFERTGEIPLRQFLMLVEILGDLQALRLALKPQSPAPQTIEDVLKNQ